MKTANPTHYDVLGIQHDADTTEVKRAFRKIAARSHPDTAGESMQHVFRLAQAAYDVLVNPEARAAYDRELAGAGPATTPSPGNVPHPEATVPPAVAPDPPAREPGDPDEFVDRSKLPKFAAGGLLLWAICLLALAFTETPHPWLVENDIDMPRGAGSVLAAGVSLLALHGALSREGWRGYAWAPLAAVVLGFGTAVAFILHHGAPIPMLLASVIGAAALVLSVLVVRRYKLLLLMGLWGRKGARAASYPEPDGETDATAPEARRHTYEALKPLLDLPGTRILSNVPAGAGGSAGHLVINGDRAAVVDSRTVSHWYRDWTGANLEEDFRRTNLSVHTTLHGDVAAFRYAGETAGWLVLYPAAAGSLKLQSAGDVQLRAASAADAAAEIAAWFRGGDRFGTFDPEFVYRIVNAGRSPLRRPPA